jgi:hypothetical protein
VVRRTFGTELQDITGVRGKSHTEELRYLFLHILYLCEVEGDVINDLSSAQEPRVVL